MLLDGSASDFKKHFQPIRSTSQMWVVTRHRYEISGLVFLIHHFARKQRETSCGVAECRLFSQPSNMKTKLNLTCHHFGVRCITDFIFLALGIKVPEIRDDALEYGESNLAVTSELMR